MGVHVFDDGLCEGAGDGGSTDEDVGVDGLDNSVKISVREPFLQVALTGDVDFGLGGEKPRFVNEPFPDLALLFGTHYAAGAYQICFAASS